MISINGAIPIRIYPVFFLIAGLIGYLYSGTVIGTAVWILVILVSVLVHEFGHALTARLFGQTARIDLVGFGGLTHHKGKILKPWQNFLVVLDGPLAGFVLAFAAYALLRAAPDIDMVVYGLTIAVYVNLFWTVVNLLPIQPLDGGKLLSIICEKVFGYKGVRFTYMFSGILSIVCSLVFFTLGAIIAGAIFLLFAFESYRSWNELRNLTALDRNEELQTMLKMASDNMETGNYAEAEVELEKILQKADKGVIHNTAVEILGKLYYTRGENEKAFELLYPIRDSLSPEMLGVLHKILGYLEKWDDVLKIGERAYSEKPDYASALVNASANAVKGSREAAIGWLKRAATDGAADIDQYVERPEFDTMRQDIRQELNL